MKKLILPLISIFVSCHSFLTFADEEIRQRLEVEVRKIRQAKKGEDQKAIDIIVKADRVRAPEKPFGYQLVLEEYHGEKLINTQTLDVSMRLFKPPANNPDFFDARALVRFIAPPKDKGKKLLADFDKMWFHSPELNNPVLISKQQRLIGQVSNGDVVAADFDYSYISQLIGEEPCGETICYKLHLVRRAPEITYPAVMYWVEKETYRPYRVDFLSTQNRLMKRTFYKDFKPSLGGIVRPHTIIVEDSLRKENYTIMKYSKLRFEDLPENYFQKEYLTRLK